MQTTTQKIKQLDELERLVAREKSAGKRIVCWHGLFDLLDLEHIRQIEAAKALGDLLVITMTPDRYLPNRRPQWSERLRAETVAALQMVDYVALSTAASAVSTIRLLKPDVFVHESGSDDSADLADETAAVEEVGGVFHFARAIAPPDDLTHRLGSPFPDEVGAWLDTFRQNHTAAEVLAAVEGLRPLRVLVLGEVILDEYVYCEGLGKSAKEPILALRYVNQEIHAGGSVAVANHLAGFCSDVRLLSYLGDTNSRDEFVASSMKSNVTPTFIRKSDSPTIVKRRFVEKYLVTKLLEIYEMNDEALNAMEEEELCRQLETLMPQCDIVIVADFGHGLIPPRAASLLCERAPFLAVNTQINAANVGFHTISKYSRADYVCIHEGEVRLDARSRRSDLHNLVLDMARRLECDRVMVTRGKLGTVFYEKESGFHTCPAFAVKVVDRLGAGDAVLAITALCAARKMPPDVIGLIGNLVGAQAVRIVGNSRSIDPGELMTSVETLLR
ncbi:MAG: PfkB family carbohydrate kinase [Thermoanaerobaculia bacterium]